MSSNNIRLFARSVFVDCVLKNIHHFKLFDQEKKFINYDERCDNSEHHSFWYCVDNCWNRPNGYFLNELEMIITMYQFLCQTIKQIENKFLEINFTNILLDYGFIYVSNFKEQLEEYQKNNNCDLRNNINDWWIGFA